MRGPESGFPLPWSGNIDITAPDPHGDAGTSQRQTHTTGELGCSAPSPCKDCECIYAGETERIYGVREKEHRRDVKTLEEKKYTRSRKKDSLMELHPSVITDHVAKENHTIDWEGVRFVTRDSDWTTRGVKEAVEIRKTGANAINRNGGHNQLPLLHSKLLVKKTSPFVTSSTVCQH